MPLSKPYRGNKALEGRLFIDTSNPLTKGFTVITPTYHLFTLLLFGIALLGLANALWVQTDKNMRFIYCMFSLLILASAVLRVLGVMQIWDISTGIGLEVSRIIWILALGGLISILGVPIAWRREDTRHDST